MLYTITGVITLGGTGPGATGADVAARLPTTGAFPFLNRTPAGHRCTKSVLHLAGMASPVAAAPMPPCTWHLQPMHTHPRRVQPATAYLYIPCLYMLPTYCLDSLHRAAAAHHSSAGSYGSSSSSAASPCCPGKPTYCPGMLPAGATPYCTMPDTAAAAAGTLPGKPPPNRGAPRGTGGGAAGGRGPPAMGAGAPTAPVNSPDAMRSCILCWYWSGRPCSVASSSCCPAGHT
jgi:hypothetical protein